MHNSDDQICNTWDITTLHWNKTIARGAENAKNENCKEWKMQGTEIQENTAGRQLPSFITPLGADYWASLDIQKIFEAIR